MDTFLQLIQTHSIEHSIFVLSLVVALGLLLGSISCFGIRLGVSSVLFVGLIFGHYDLTFDPKILEFCRDFGLILFVYSIGMQVGPGFISSLRREGLVLNLLAGFVVIAGGLITIGLHLWGHIPMSLAVGMFTGATTNPSSLGAAQQALSSLPGITDEALKLPGLGYAVAYPFGIVGVILTMMALKIIFRINLKQEAPEPTQTLDEKPLCAMNIRVDNPNLNDIAITNIPYLEESGVVISRVMHHGKVRVAVDESRIFVGDIVYAVGPQKELKDLILTIGHQSDVDVRQIKSNIMAQKLIVTKPDVVGKAVGDLNIWERYSITLTRVSRANIEFAASKDLQFHYGDIVFAVGEEEDIKEFAIEIGHASENRNVPFVIPLFIGVVSGIFIGSWPITFPGIPFPIKLGLAGGPLIAALVLSRIGRIGKFIWHMPLNANLMLRELGIVLFLSSVGLESGKPFIETLVAGQGFYWLACGGLITIIPLLIAAVWGRIKLKMNYLTLCGVLAGSMTNAPALAFANSLSPSNAASVSCATVYPLVMLLRVVLAQILVLYFIH